jgi:cell division septation protein DedD
MRSAGALVLTLCAAGCGGELSRAAAAGSNRNSGPDAVLVRIPTAGGTARAYRWGRDSVIWTSTQPVQAVRSLLAFDDEQGTVAFVDTKGTPNRLELRLGTIVQAAKTPMTSLASVDGWAIYGINPKREMERLTPGGNWNHPSAFTPRQILPQVDGSVVLMNDLGNRTVLRRMHPPEARITDTASVPQAAFAVNTPLGDRIYFATDSGLAGVRVRDLARTKTIDLNGPARDAVPTPSGDRIFVALHGRAALAVIDRYEERISGRVELQGYPEFLRMDPDGRFLLAKLDSHDSVAVISVAESRVVRVLHSLWRADLPLVAPDGAVLTLDGEDALDVDPVSGKVRRKYLGGASDQWALVRWNGFRPRAKGLDEPVVFEADSADSAAAARADSNSAANFPTSPATVRPQFDAPIEERRNARSAGWTLSFAALLDSTRAQAMAKTIVVEGKSVRVISGMRDRVTIWRVLAGPFATKDEAEKAGRRTGLPFWVYEEYQ